ncbi:hypothetical protein C3B58_06860 [Lactonifactor longoviformis]|uniref:Uncharacterized protein n=1 Tax=Lactonifactor longoviformis DSM 17459 TaxID=1122155 RepID=A0A1M4WWR3_9CLOT|nr:hypothetical protein [Lactonifactor longoviformis]POP33566.1 hypothetical protein C3B58_06860 [Lactonifactor longoviformis]SHE85630.1 hypothetical protein SAMN02745158_01766 [Lactonifactor longoviformis DSM 17459]
MKTAVISFLSLLLLVLTGAAVLTVHGRSIRKSEMEESAAIAIEQSMEILYADQTYEIRNETELVADFLINLCCQIESYGDIEISVMNVDYEKGMLELLLKEKYRHFTGKEGVITCRRAVILEKRG